MSPRLRSVLQCPHCGFKAIETMPVEACVAFHPCSACGRTIRPRPGHCCVFCSWGTVPCPPEQRRRQRD